MRFSPQAKDPKHQNFTKTNAVASPSFVAKKEKPRSVDNLSPASLTTSPSPKPSPNALSKSSPAIAVSAFFHLFVPSFFFFPHSSLLDVEKVART